MTDITIIILSLGIGFIIGYFTSYSKEKGKNRALIEDLKAMTEEKEKVSSHYQLDISKRKYMYEDKRAMYMKYFTLLDELQTEANKIALAEVLPAINNFMEMHLSAGEDENELILATNELTKAANNAMSKMHESQMKLKQETNSIRLFAGDLTLLALKEMETHYDYQLEKTAEMMKNMGSFIINKNQSALANQQMEQEIIAKKTMELKENIFKEMKNELNQI
jgi:hypothetical protein